MSTRNTSFLVATFVMYAAILCASCSDPRDRTGNRNDQRRGAYKVCDLPDNIAIRMSVDDNVATIEISNQSENRSFSMKDLQGFSRKRGPRGNLWIAVKDGQRLISETDLSPDGWWTVEVLSSNIYDSEDDLVLRPGARKNITINWTNMLLGLDDQSDRFSRINSPGYIYNILTSVEKSNGSTYYCDTGWF